MTSEHRVEWLIKATITITVIVYLMIASTWITVVSLDLKGGLRLPWPAWGFDGRKRPVDFLFTVDPRTRYIAYEEKVVEAMRCGLRLGAHESQGRPGVSWIFDDFHGLFGLRST